MLISEVEPEPRQTSPATAVEACGSRRRAVRPALAVLVVGVLVVTQASALLRQFELGFRPFSRAPSRVPLSWDMFATHITRCAVTWTPPLQPQNEDGRVVRSVADLSRGLEWGPVADSISGYLRFTRKLCARSRAVSSLARSAQLVCYQAVGEEMQIDVPCP